MDIRIIETKDRYILQDLERKCGHINDWPVLKHPFGVKTNRAGEALSGPNRDAWLRTKVRASKRTLCEDCKKVHRAEIDRKIKSGELQVLF